MEVLENKINQKTVRFSDAEWYKPNIPVIIGGIGSIGSHLSYYLGRQEAELYLYDMDTVDEVNIGGQLYSIDSVGKKKTEITKELIKSLSGNTKVSCFGKFDESGYSNPYMFSCFDNMKARKIFFDAWCREEDENKLFIDGRMSSLGELGQIYFVTTQNIDKYKEELFDDTEVPDLPCTYKSSTHTGAFIASIMVAGFNNFIANINMKENLRDVPFKLEYNLQTFQLT